MIHSLINNIKLETMKKLILIAIIVLVGFACQKETIKKVDKVSKNDRIEVLDTNYNPNKMAKPIIKKPIKDLPDNPLDPCIELDTKKFYGTWKYVSVQYRNDQFPRIEDYGEFSKVTIDVDSVRFTDMPHKCYKWNNLGCSIIRNLSSYEDIKVSFFGYNMMTYTGLKSGAIWILKRL